MRIDRIRQRAMCSLPGITTGFFFCVASVLVADESLNKHKATHCLLSIDGSFLLIMWEMDRFW